MGSFPAPVRRLGVRLQNAWRGPLAERPRPLLDPENGLMVVWAAKAACTATFVWFADRIGVEDELRRSGKAPHVYRREIYHRSDLYRRGRALPLGRYVVLHVLRDPYSRAVSSYRQALRTGYADKRLRHFPTGPLDSRTGYSFAQYLDYLDSIDLARANIHHRLQLHPVEARRRPDHVINISKQDLLGELNRFEEHCGWPRTDFAALSWLQARESRRRARTRSFGSGSAAELTLDMAAAARAGAWPDYEESLSPAVRRRIECLYAADFEAFAAHL